MAKPNSRRLVEFNALINLSLKSNQSNNLILEGSELGGRRFWILLLTKPNEGLPVSEEISRWIFG